MVIDICLNDAREYVIAIISYDIVNNSFKSYQLFVSARLLLDMHYCY